MMTVTPMMSSSSSSTATVVSMVSPENTCLGHWARIRLRMIRRTARVKVEENSLDPEDNVVRILGHIPPQAAHIRKGHHSYKSPLLKRDTHSHMR